MQKQSQVQKQTLKYSPQQIQLLNLLHLTSLELEQRIKEELEENPVLEEGIDEDVRKEEDIEYTDLGETVGTGDEVIPAVQDYYDWDEYSNDDIPSYKLQVNNLSVDDEVYTKPMVELLSFRDELKEQIHFLNLSEGQQAIADFLLDSLDEDGFLRRDCDVIADDISFANSVFIETEDVEQMLRVIQKLDPPGIASRNLKECLLIQMERKPLDKEENKLAYKLISQFFDELGNRNYDKIIRILEVDEQLLKKALQVITSLNPKPSSGLRNDHMYNETIKPDFLLTYIGDKEIEVQLTWGNSPSLRMSKLFTKMATQKNDKATNQFLKTKISSAKWFIDAIKQRETTLLNTMKAIVSHQFEYFISGDIKKLKPMILKDIADLIGMDISTVSRVTTNKYVQTPFGIVLLKSLFTEGIATDNGDEVSNKAIQEAIKEIIEVEDKRKPFNDQQITDMLEKKGFPVARRTVAKYREQLNIPTARLRVSI